MIRINSFKHQASPRLRLIMVSALLLPLVGCVWVEDTTDLKRFVAETTARPVGQLTPLPEYVPYEAFVYEGSSLRNPFTALVPEASEALHQADDVTPDFTRQKDYLEQFSVDNLTMVGTISAPGMQEALWALVRDPTGEVHRVAPGDFLGLDHGQVNLLTERRLELIEIVSNGRGGWMQRPRAIVLTEQN